MKTRHRNEGAASAIAARYCSLHSTTTTTSGNVPDPNANKTVVVYWEYNSSSKKRAVSKAVSGKILAGTTFYAMST